jgi:hypothetical protein
MQLLVGVLIFAVLLALLAAPMVLVDRRRHRRHAEIVRQIALTDALHARLGAVVAPVVRRRRRAWQIAVAVPVERPAVVAAVLATVDEVFGAVAYEVLLQRQAPAVARPSSRRPAPLGQESLSWT